MERFHIDLFHTLERIIDESLSDYGGNVWDSTMHYWTVCITSPIHDSNDFSMDSLFDQLNSQIKKPLVFSKLSGSTHHYTYIYSPQYEFVPRKN